MFSVYNTYMTPTECDYELQIERIRKLYVDLRDATGQPDYDSALTWIKRALEDARNQEEKIRSLTELLSNERDRSGRLRDQLAEERGSKESLEKKVSGLAGELRVTTMARDQWKTNRDLLYRDLTLILEAIGTYQQNDALHWVKNAKDRITDLEREVASSNKMHDAAHEDWLELATAAIGPGGSHKDALNWIKMAAAVIPGCVDSAKNEIAAEAKVVELEVEVAEQQVEILDLKSLVACKQNSRDYWYEACGRLTRAVGIDAINDAVEWVKNAKRDLLSLAEIGRTKDWQISDLSKQLILAKEGLGLRNKQNLDLCSKVIKLETKVINQAKELTSAKCDLGTAKIFFDRANGLILAAGTYDYDHALDWIKRHRRSEEAYSLLGDKV